MPAGILILKPMKRSKVYIAIPLNKEIKKNQTYYFRGGILMANSEKLNFSQAYDAVRIVSVLSNYLGSIQYDE